MGATKYRGVVRAGAIVLLDPMPLADGTEVLVTPVGNERGSAAAILAAIKSVPKVPSEWVEELEELTAQGLRPRS